MTDPVTIGTAGTKFIKTATTVGLTFSNAATGTSTLYTVPAAKKFYVLSCMIGSSSTTGQSNAYILANGINIAMNSANADASGATNTIGTIEMCFELAAGQTIQFTSVRTTGSNTGTVFGVECDV